MQRQHVVIVDCYFCCKTVNIRSSIDYEVGDKTFYFCSKECLKRFKRAMKRLILRE